jgi:hypothetical protein
MKRKRLLMEGVLVLAALLFGCQIPPSNAAKGADGMSARSMATDADLAPAYYLMRAEGPEGIVFSETGPVARIRFTATVAGDWTVTAGGYNSLDELILSGQKTLALASGQTKTVRVTAKPISGEGTFDLTVLWDAHQHPSAEVQTKFTLKGGMVLPLNLELSDGTARAVEPQAPAGRYTLVVKLKENGRVAAKQSETAWVYNGATTWVVIDFRGSCALTIVEDLRDPLPVSISGVVDPLERDGSMTLRPAEEIPGVEYRWYLNAVPYATGPLCTVVGSGLRAGPYRVDLVATDGLRGGSASATFRLSE